MATDATALKHHPFPRTQALADHLRIEPSEVEDGDHFDDCSFIFVAEGNEFLVLTHDEAEEAARFMFERTFTDMSPGFFSKVTGIHTHVITDITHYCEPPMQVTLLRAIAEATCGWEKLRDTALEWDTRGSWLATYDGSEEYEWVDHECWFIYRMGRARQHGVNDVPTHTTAIAEHLRGWRQKEGSSEEITP